MHARAYHYDFLFLPICLIYVTPFAFCKHKKMSVQSLIYLWSKVCNVGLLLLQGCLRDKHGEVAVLHTQFLNFLVKEVFNRLPD